MKKIGNILLVGFGGIAQRHLRLLREISMDGGIYILRSREDPVTTSYVSDIFQSLAELDSLQFDSVIIASPSSLHRKHVDFFAKRNVNLLIEKPLASSLGEAFEIKSTCIAAGISPLVGYNLRYCDSLKIFKAMLEERAIGRILSLHCEVGGYMPDWRPSKDYRQSVSAIKSLGGGVLRELSHEIDYLAWIFGRINWVQGSISTQSDCEIDVEDTASLILGFESNDNQLIATLNMSFVRRDPARYCSVVGDEGSLRWNGIAGTVEIFLKDEKVWRSICSYENDIESSYRRQMLDFMSKIPQGSRLGASVDDGINVLRVIEAVELSSTSGMRREVAYGI